MRKPNKSLGTFIFLILFGFFVFCSSVAAQEIPDQIHITSDTTWTKATPNLNFNQSIVIENDATLTIEKGTRVVFNNPSSPFSVSGIRVASGKLIVNGTREEKVVFDSPDNGFSLSFGDTNRESFLRYVEIINGGLIFAAPDAGDMGGDLVPQFPALEISGGKVHLENSRFSHSRFTEISVYDSPVSDAEGNPVYDENGNPIENKAKLEVVNSNFSHPDAVQSGINCRTYNENNNEHIDQECTKRVYLKDNWYNHPFGPTTDNDVMAKGYRITGFHYLDLWKTSEDIFNPAIVIPGVMGSAKVAKEWKMDPILHTYDDLLESLDINGYAKNKNLFEFPYDWERSNEMSAQKLKTKIADIIKETKVSKVDLAAHSMGGLVARSYIESDDYGNNVDKLITMGTPHNGAVKSYLKWEAGEGFFTIADKVAKHHFEMEALHNRYTNLYAYIREWIPSVKELLPDYNYLFDVSENAMRDYPNDYPRNTFLENLNKESNLEKLKDIDFTNIVGVLDNNQSTISKIRVVDSTVSDRWLDGMPENYYDDETDRGLERGKGDQTVPEKSAENIPADKTLKANATHSDLPTVSQCAVLYELTQKNDCTKVVKTHIPNLLMINVFSPVDLQVIAPSGQRVGKNFQTGEILTEIPGAYYTGHDTENEFLTIPNPEDGEYRILTQGTGEGEYRIEATKIIEDEATGEATEAIATIAGIATIGTEEEKTIEVKGAEVISEAKDLTPPAITLHSPQANQSYLNNQSLTIDYALTDNITEPENIPSQVFLDGGAIGSLQIDLALQRLGQHQIKITAQDEANNQSGKETTFQIETNLLALTDNVQHYFELGLIKTKREKTTLAQLLRGLSEYQKLSDKILANPRLSEKAKARMRIATKIHFNRQIDALIRHISRRTNRTIDPLASERLMEGLELVRIK